MPFLNGYQLTEAKTCIKLCNIAYDQENSKDYLTIKTSINESLTQLNQQEGSNWVLVWLGLSVDYGNLMYMAENLNVPNTFVIAHRGTDWKYLDDVVQDMDVYKTSPLGFIRPPRTDIYVAKGAIDGLNVLMQMTDNTTLVPGLPQQVGILDLIRNYQRQNPLNIYVTGHSLGGALATLFSTWLLEIFAQESTLLNPVNVKTYTIASPTVGNQAYADYYNSKVTTNGPIGFQGFRIHNMQDLVPHAFANLADLPGSGIPVGPLLKDVLNAAVAAVGGALHLEGIAYVPAGEDHPLTNMPPVNPPACPNPAKGIKDYGCWVGYEHSLDTYLAIVV